jgi:abequosyltransferase
MPKNKHLLPTLSDKPLLTIAIPTYNRSKLLELCLDSIIGQVRDSPKNIEILLFNNASTDNTREVAEKYISEYPNINYSENDMNRGPDYNIGRCFRLANAKYVWVFSDDDLLLPRAIERIMPLLQGEDLAIIALAVRFYRGSVDKSLYPYEELSYRLYHSPIVLAQELHLWLTYITGIIVNKEVACECGVYYPSEDSHLIQLGWVIPALFSSYSSAKVETPLILGRALPVLDFMPFYVFGTSYISVLKTLVRLDILPSDAMEMLIDLIITEYFALHISSYCKYHHGEHPLLILGRSFWNRRAFWLYIFPIFVRRALLKLSTTAKIRTLSTIKGLLRLI